MNKIKTGVYASLLVLSLLIGSCDLERSKNGYFDGYWHLTSVDTLSTGGRLDLSNDLIFWAVQLHLLNVVDQGRDSTHLGYLLYFRLSSTRLEVYEPYVNNKEEGDIKLKDPTPLKPFGINGLKDKFNIERLDKGYMELANDSLRLSFRKM